MEKTLQKRHAFTLAEKRELMKLVLEKYKEIVDSKACDAISVRKKAIAWNRIACKYNTSAIAPYPASGKQLRRLWNNLKQRDKGSIVKFKQELGLERTSDIERVGENSESSDVEESTVPHFVNVERSSDISENPDDSLKIIPKGVKNENYSTGTDCESQPFDVEFIEESEDERPMLVKNQHADKVVNKVKRKLLVQEYHDRKRRLNELHLLQKRLLLEQIREAKAKANLAELELKQQRFLEQE